MDPEPINWDETPIFHRTRKAAAFLRRHFGLELTSKDLARMRAKGNGPPYSWFWASRAGSGRKAYRYRPEELAEWGRSTRV